MRFWDSSAIVPLYVEQAKTGWARELLRTDHEMAVWWSGRTECVSAFCRLRRDGDLDAAALAQILRALRTDAQGWVTVTPSDPLRDAADELLARHPLRADDALQLAAALVFCQRRPKRLPVVSLDARLVQVARAEGFEVLDGGLA